MKTLIIVQCATEKLFNQFMGRGKMPSLFKGSYLTEVHKMVEKQKKKDPTATYTFVEKEVEGKTIRAEIEIHGTDRIVKDTYNMSKRELRKFNTKVALKSLRTKMSVKLIK